MNLRSGMVLLAFGAVVMFGIGYALGPDPITSPSNINNVPSYPATSKIDHNIPEVAPNVPANQQRPLINTPAPRRTTHTKTSTTVSTPTPTPTNVTLTTTPQPTLPTLPLPK